jgi:AcrR family transcriptional regulator
MAAMTTTPAVEPLRVQFRRQVREAALDVAQAMLVERGWEHVTVSAVAAGVGVSRPTFYKEFASKQALGEALVRRETDRFLTGVAEVLEQHTADADAAIAAAVRFTLLEAEASPLLRAVLTSTRGGDESLLPLLTTRSAPLLEAASAALTGWFDEHFPELDAQTVAEGVDAVVRLVVSHLVLPAAPAEETARRLARVATRYLRDAG